MQGERLAERRVGRSLLLPVLATWECCVSQMKILGNVYDFLISCHEPAWGHDSYSDVPGAALA
jgi:hypothetical protein